MMQKKPYWIRNTFPYIPKNGAVKIKNENALKSQNTKQM